MRPGSANVRSPEVIRRLRHRVVEFEEKAHVSLGSARGDVGSILEWIDREQLPRWRLELRRRHERMQEAWRLYVDARYGDRRMGKPSCVDERKAWERARRAKEEAEEKIRTIEHWKGFFEAEVERIMPPCRRFELLIYNHVPKALAHLDHLLDRLEEYLKANPPPAP